MKTSLKLTIAGIAVAAIAWLAFGFFGIQAAFIDNEVSEANPFATIATEPVVEESAEAREPVEVSEPIAVSEPAAVAGEQAEGLTVDTEAAPEPVAPEPTPETEDLAAPAVPEIVTLASGSLVDHAHGGDGTINVITDGNQTFLRFEDDFAVDNGPDLNVYLVRGADAEGDSGLFDDDFIDLGDLKGNIGAQNYELDPDIDLSEYDTVVIWCVRFGVAFNAANLS